MDASEYLEQFRAHHTTGPMASDDGSPEFALELAARCMACRDYALVTAWATMAQARQALLDAQRRTGGLTIDKY